MPPGTEFWSIALQENVSSKKTLYVKATHYNNEGEPIFGMLQLRFENILLQQYIGEDAIGYTNQHNGDISVDFKKCIFIKELKEEQNEKNDRPRSKSNRI